MSETDVIQLRDLQSLLRTSMGDDLTVIEYKTEPLLPLGENYGSTIMKVQAIVKRNNDEEQLNLVAKMIPASETQRIMFDIQFTFKKEAYLYEELIPQYQRLEREFGVPEVFDIVAKIYGVRYSLTGDQVDEDAVILMENLKVSGYYMADRKTGLDLAHAEKAVTALARFHALGIAMRQHKPEVFEIIRERSKCLEFKDETFQEVFNYYRSLMLNDAELSEYRDLVDGAMHENTLQNWTKPPPETWSTITHADFWINNIMFRRDPATDRIDVKFVDFQNYLNLSPLRELSFFLGANLSAEVMDQHFDKVLDCYYETFMFVLKKLKCNVQPYSRKKFDERLKIDAFEEFPHCPFMFKIMTMSDLNDPEQIENIAKLMMDGQLNSLAMEKLRRCVKKFAEKGWLGEYESTSL